MGSVSIVVQVGENSTALITCSDFRAHVYIEALYLPNSKKHNFALAFPALKAPKHMNEFMIVTTLRWSKCEEPPHEDRYDKLQ